MSNPASAPAPSPTASAPVAGVVGDPRAQFRDLEHAVRHALPVLALLKCQVPDPDVAMLLGDVVNGLRDALPGGDPQ